MGNPKPRRTQAERRETSIRLILSAAKKLVADRGYDRFSLQDVGREAGCSYELVNHYFGSKDGLLVAVAEYIHEKSKALDENAVQSSNPLENLIAKIKYTMGLSDRDPTTFCAWVRLVSEAPFHHELLELIVSRRSEIVSNYAKLIKDGQDQGTFKSDVDAQVYGGLIYEFLRGHSDVVLLSKNRVKGKGQVKATPPEAFLTFLKNSLEIPE